MRTLILLASVLFAPLVFASGSYLTYVNERYGYRIAYPADFLPQGVADAGDGQAFLSPAGDAELRVFASSCVVGINATPSEYFAGFAKEQKAKHLTVSYHRLGKHYAVVSGRRNGRIYYDKILINDGWCTQFNFDYDERQSIKYDAVTTYIASSLKR